MGGDQLVVHVPGVRGRIANPVETVDFRQFADQAAEAPGSARAESGPISALEPAGRLPGIGVDVLAQQRDLPRAAGDHAPGLRDNGRGRARIFGAARIGHDAEGAELVATFLHGEEGGRPLASAFLRQEIELLVGLEFLVDGAACAPGFGQEFGQAVIRLRAEDQIDHRRAPADFRALGLGDAAGDGDRRLLARGPARLLDALQAPELGINLFGRLFPNVAGVEDDEVGILRPIGLPVSAGCQHIRHAGGIVHVHLAAVGLDIDRFLHASVLPVAARGL